MIEFKAMFPVMVVEDLNAIKSFYESVFGFHAVFYDSDFYLHLVSPSNGVQLGFLVPHHESQPSLLHAKMVSEGYVISLEVSDATVAYDQIMGLNIDVAMPLKEETWGQRHFIIRDPAGIHIDIVQHLEPPTQ